MKASASLFMCDSHTSGQTVRHRVKAIQKSNVHFMDFLPMPLCIWNPSSRFAPSCKNLAILLTIITPLFIDSVYSPQIFNQTLYIMSPIYLYYCITSSDRCVSYTTWTNTMYSFFIGFTSVAFSYFLLIAMSLPMKPFQNSLIKNDLSLNPHKILYIS